MKKPIAILSLALLCGCSAEVKLQVESAVESKTNAEPEPVLFSIVDISREPEKRPEKRFTYFVSIPTPTGAIVYKTSPPPIFGHDKPNRIDGLSGIGATVFLEDEWNAVTNRFGTNTHPSVIDLTDSRKGGDL